MTTSMMLNTEVLKLQDFDVDRVFKVLVKSQEGDGTELLKSGLWTYTPFT